MPGQRALHPVERSRRHRQPHLARCARARGVRGQRRLERLLVQDDELLVLTDRREALCDSYDATFDLICQVVERDPAAGACGGRDRGADEKGQRIAVGRLTGPKAQRVRLLEGIREAKPRRVAAPDRRRLPPSHPVAPVRDHATAARRQRPQRHDAGRCAHESALVVEVKEPRAPGGGERELEADHLAAPVTEPCRQRRVARSCDAKAHSGDVPSLVTQDERQ